MNDKQNPPNPDHTNPEPTTQSPPPSDVAVLDDILTEDRITRMRTDVMKRVDGEITAVGTANRDHRRSQWVMGSAAAAVIVAIIGGAALVTAEGDRGDASSSTASEGNPDDMAFQLRDQAAAPETALAGAVAPPAGGPEIAFPENTGPLDEGREVITTGTITVTSDDTAGTVRDIAAWAESHGGRIDYRSESSDDDSGRAELTIRVPSDTVSAAVDRVGELGKVTSVEISHEDVTAAATDLDARIEAGEVAVARLLRIMAEAKDSGDLLAAETALSQRQGDLESLRAQRASITDQVSLSTLTITVTEPRPEKAAAPKDGDGFTDNLADGWHGLTSFGGWLAGLAGVLLPWLGAGLVLAALGWAVLRGVRLRRG